MPRTDAADRDLPLGVLALQMDFVIPVGAYGETLVVDWGLANADGHADTPESA